MATKVITQVLCDKCDAESTEPTRQYRSEGVEYEVDLCTKCTEALAKVFRPFTSVSRRVGGKRLPAKANVSKDRGYDTVEVRTWARSSGIEVPARGRIPQAIIEQFLAAAR